MTAGTARRPAGAVARSLGSDAIRSLRECFCGRAADATLSSSSVRSSIVVAARGASLGADGGGLRSAEARGGVSR